MNRFEGKVVLVTGAGRGQGRAHAVAFAREGADVAICDIANQIDSVPYELADEAALRETADLIRTENQQVISEIVDVRRYEQVDAFTRRAITELGKVDVAIANAGILSFGPSEELSEGQFRDVLETNLLGVWHTFKAVIPHMKERQYGRLIATASAAAIKAAPNLAHYVAAKHGVVGLVKSIAIETGGDGITANAVCPGNIPTAMVFNDAVYEMFNPTEPSKANVEAGLEQMNVQPGGWMEPEEISNAMLYLASDQASRMTGTVTVVDMGMTLK